MHSLPSIPSTTLLLEIASTLQRALVPLSARTAALFTNVEDMPAGRPYEPQR
jgi:hypothetical protein